jgi:gluconokinase
MTCVVAVDLGSSSVRARVYDDAGTARGDGARRSYGSLQGTMNPEALVEAAVAVLAEVGEGEAIGCSAFWHSLLALDARNRPLTPVLTWRDVRSAPYAEQLRERLDEAAVHARTGCFLHPSYWPAKLAWLRAEDAETFRRARRFVSFPDYLLLRLTGELRAGLSQASATGLWAREGWDEGLLQELGVRPQQLAPVSDDRVGAWFPPLGDGACSNVGAGCVTPERAALMLGTSGALRIVRTDDDAVPRRGLFRYRLDESRTVEGGSLSDAGNLYAWLERTLRLPTEPSPAEREPDAHGLTFLTLLGGERSPGWHPDAKGALAGLTLETTPLDILQAALEGVAYRFAEILDLMPEVETIVSTGAALAANPGWTQILADVLARPILPGVAEGSLRGAAIIALQRLGASPAEPSLGDAFVPRPDRTDAYRSARERQRNLYRGVT